MEKERRKPPFSLILCAVLVWSLFLLFTMIRDSGKVHIRYNGFAVDSEENLYIGMRDEPAYDNRIYVFDFSGTLLRSFPAVTNRGYSFTIVDGDKIMYSASQVLYTADLSGNILEKEEIPLAEDIRYSETEFVDVNGNRYEMKNRFFRPSIYQVNRKNGAETCIYQMPMLDSIVLLGEKLVGLSLILFAAFFIRWIYQRKVSSVEQEFAVEAQQEPRR